MAEQYELQLASGRILALRELRQYRTYESLLEGLPTTEDNQQIIARLVANPREQASSSVPHNSGISWLKRRFTKPRPPSPRDRPYLIQPTETLIAYGNAEPYPFGTPAELPAITCIGRFASVSPAHNENCDGSQLVVIWFQACFALPIDPEVLKQLRAIDWETHATDVNY